MAASHARTPAFPALRPPGVSVRIRRRYHFGYGGFLYILVTLLVALGAFNSQNNLLYWTFGFALALVLVSGVISGAMLMGVRVEREWISGARVGETLRVRYRVRNTNRLFAAFALTIEERGFDEPLSSSRPALWRRLLRASPPPASPPPLFARPRAFVAHVGPREAVHAEARVLARRRGAASFTGIVVHTSFPFGLMRKSLRIDQHGATVVTPLPASVELGPARGAARSGCQSGQTRRSGRGDEFFSLREYVHGDSPRDVAWRASARRGSLLVRQFGAPAPQRLWIVLHLRTHPGSDGADERAIRVAAGLARKAESRGMEYALAVPLARLVVYPRRGEGHLSRLTTDLGLLDLGPDDGRGARCAFPPQATGVGASCIVVHGGSSDDGFAPRADHIAHMVARASDGWTDCPPARPESPKGGSTRAA